MSAADEAARWCDLTWGDRRGVFFFALGVGGHFNAQGRYAFEHWFERHGRWPGDRERFLEEAIAKSGECDVYAAPYLRASPSRKKGNALASDVAYADVDDLRDDLRGFENLLLGPASFVVRSGIGLHVYLRLPQELEPPELERWNRRLAHRLYADAGWAENKVLRLPGTLNHKARAKGARSVPVSFVEFQPHERDWTLEELGELLPEVPVLGQNGGEPITAAPLARPLPPHVEERLHEAPGDDRSSQSFSFLALCLEHGLSDGEALSAGLEHKPTLTKYGSRASVEIERAIRKLRTGRGDLNSPNSLNSHSSSSDWPIVGEAPFYGLAGDVVTAISPHSEADPIALLAQLLVSFGNVIGRRAHFTVEADRHAGNINAVLVGTTSKGRKGTAWSHVRGLVSDIDASWLDRVHAGLSSGEGLIWHVRDPITKVEDGEEKILDDGVSDKRLLVAETEFASVLKVLCRDGNTLSPVLRRAWDDGTLQTLTKNSPTKATGAHVSVVGHITAEELQRYLDRTEIANGLANRFLWLLVRRSKLLPRGGSPDKKELAELSWRLLRAVEFAQGVDRAERDEEAFELWDAEYERLSRGRPGLVGALTSRAEAQTLRLALLYALLDQSANIRVDHLRAALALWDYAERSVALIFGESTGNPDSDTILRSLKNADGLTRTEVSNLFGRHVSAARLDRALGLLLETGLVHFTREQTDGRPAERWKYGPAKEAKEAK